MQTKSKKKLHTIIVEFESGMTRTVKVKAVERSTAEQKALKFNPAAKGVKRG